MEKYGTRWLSGMLGVSLARARKLLGDGRIQGAWKNPRTGEWFIPDGRYELSRGKRGPRSLILKEAFELCLSTVKPVSLTHPVVAISDKGDLVHGFEPIEGSDRSSNELDLARSIASARLRSRAVGHTVRFL